MAEGDQAALTVNTEVGGGAGAMSAQGTVNAAPDDSSEDAPLSPLEAQLEMVIMERDDYRQKLESIQEELAALTAASPDADTINKLQQDNDHLRKTLKKATDILREKIISCNVQEKKNAALNQQVITLKEVLQVTKDLLNIRNLEVEQLQKNVDTMEARIDDNRKRQTAMIKQMAQATQINGQLRTEYETQLQIFQSLKERYEEKVTALTKLANERQRHNSEGSEKFEDAPDIAEGSESINETEQSTSIPPTDSSAEPSNEAEVTTNISEVAPTETPNASEEILSEKLNPSLEVVNETNVSQIAPTETNTTQETTQAATDAL